MPRASRGGTHDRKMRSFGGLSSETGEREQAKEQSLIRKKGRNSTGPWKIYRAGKHRQIAALVSCQTSDVCAWSDGDMGFCEAIIWCEVLCKRNSFRLASLDGLRLGRRVNGHLRPPCMCSASIGFSLCQQDDCIDSTGMLHRFPSNASRVLNENDRIWLPGVWH